MRGPQKEFPPNAEGLDVSSLNLTMYLVGKLDSSNPVRGAACADIENVIATATADNENKPFSLFVV